MILTSSIVGPQPPQRKYHDSRFFQSLIFRRNENEKVTDTIRAAFHTAKGSYLPFFTTHKAIPEDDLENSEEEGNGQNDEFALLLYQLQDPEEGQPNGTDLHDEKMRDFYQTHIHDLPASLPPRHMHIINHITYTSTDHNPLYPRLLPRLCDGIATALYETSTKCLEQFLDPSIRVFEWRHTTDSNSNIIIRRTGTRVLCGVYTNHGFHYYWSMYVRSSIDLSGRWTDTFAATSSGTTCVTAQGVEWDEFVPEQRYDECEAGDRDWALYMGRCLAYRLIVWRAWRACRYAGLKVEWETDGEMHEKPYLVQE
ncbi:hypothetical protein EJ04DRAFT_569929 [Polyplosphaeria fusca]|uniref:Uncharacterized protein n=1 Tax=Polyplosphaeria fusca TaxID=682080 RepID=A0A9P4QNE1_9PLEO|nr:hypothetical protein EJ04DRAFT_569929 [Polyplosphaeria fusca]